MFLEFWMIEDSGQDLDNRNVDRLLDVFRLEGCDRDDPGHAIPVLADDGVLANVDSQALQRTPTGAQRLSFPTSINLTCLHGRHRICAAQHFLPASDRWWMVKIFDTSKKEKGL